MKNIIEHCANISMLTLIIVSGIVIAGYPFIASEGIKYILFVAFIVSSTYLATYIVSHKIREHKKNRGLKYVRTKINYI